MTAPQVRTPGGNRASAGHSTTDRVSIAPSPFCGNTADVDRKAFEALRAAAAFAGYTLSRTNPADGTVTFYATRWGLVRELRDLAAVAAFLTQIGGAA